MAVIPTVIDRYIAALKNHDIEIISDAVSDDLAFVMASRILDKEQFLQMLRALYSGFPDWHYEHDPPEVWQDLIRVRWRQGGTHTGTFTFPGLAPIHATGGKVQIPEHDFFYHVKDDQIVEIRPDPVPGGAPGGILEQLGVKVPAF
jgi:predicted ester cyclase